MLAYLTRWEWESIQQCNKLIKDTVLTPSARLIDEGVMNNDDNSCCCKSMLTNNTHLPPCDDINTTAYGLLHFRHSFLHHFFSLSFHTHAIMPFITAYLCCYWLCPVFYVVTNLAGQQCTPRLNACNSAATHHMFLSLLQSQSWVSAQHLLLCLPTVWMHQGM